MNAYGVENLNATGATDILVAAVREGKLEASELAGAMGGVIPIASNMGVGFDEVGAAMAAMSRTGTNAAVGATQLTAILASIKKPTEEASQTLNAMGTSQEEVSKSLAEKGLMPTLLDLSERLKATGTDASAIFPNIRALKGVLDLTGKGVADNVKIFDALGNTMGATDEAFQKTSKSASFQFKQGMETMKASLLEIGQIILPAVIKAVQSLSGFIKGLSNTFKNLSPTAQKIALTLTAILGAAGPLILIFGKIVTAITSLGPVLKIAAVGFRLLTSAMLANPILAVAAAIAAVVLALNNYKKAQKEATAETVKTLDKKQIDDRLKAAEAELKYLDTLEAKRRFSVGAHKAKTKELNNEIELLKQRKEVLNQQTQLESKEVETATAEGVSTDPITVDITPIVNPEDAKIAAEKLKKLQNDINSALVTNDEQAYQKRRADAIAYYDGLINDERTTAEQIVSLENAKQAKLSEIDNEEKQRKKDNNAEKLQEERNQQQQLLNLKQQIADATGASDEKQKALEVERIKLHFEELRRMAAEHGLLTSDQQKAFDDAQAEQEAAVYEEKKVRFAGFMMSMTEAQEMIQQIGAGIDQSFGAMTGSITKAFGGAESASGAFVGTLAKDTLKIIGNNLKASMSNSIQGATQTANSFGPAAAFVLPALIAGATALITSSFSKFAAGGIVSGPTMGLVGEYPGARQNPEVIAPLNKLQGMIGGGGQNVNVTGNVSVSGQDLLIAIERANETADRIY